MILKQCNFYLSKISLNKIYFPYQLISSRYFCAEEKAETTEVSDVPAVPTRPCRQNVDVETGLKYMDSKAYKMTYGDALVWQPYRRNHKGAFPSKKTRDSCFMFGKKSGNPCPICRDDYLVLHPKNYKLLKQFVSPHSGDIISYSQTGVCQKEHKNLSVAIRQAQDLGYIEIPVPFRRYNYEDYYDLKSQTSSNNS